VLRASPERTRDGCCSAEDVAALRGFVQVLSCSRKNEFDLMLKWQRFQGWAGDRRVRGPHQRAAVPRDREETRPSPCGTMIAVAGQEGGRTPGARPGSAR
jgi:hypothetical protein